MIIKTVKYTLITLWHPLYALLCHARTCLYSDQSVLPHYCFCSTLHAPFSGRYPALTEQQFIRSFIPFVYPCCVLSAAWRGGCFLPPSSPLCPLSVFFPTYETMGGTPPPLLVPLSATLSHLETHLHIYHRLHRLQSQRWLLAEMGKRHQEAGADCKALGVPLG